MLNEFPECECGCPSGWFCWCCAKIEECPGWTGSRMICRSCQEPVRFRRLCEALGAYARRAERRQGITAGKAVTNILVPHGLN